MTTVTIFKNLVDKQTYRSLDGETVQRKDMLSDTWYESKRDIRDIRNQSVSNVIVISEGAEQDSTVTFSARVRRWFRRVDHVKLSQ